MTQTKLIQLINNEGIFPQTWTTRDEIDQVSIDAITKKILKNLTPEDIVEHNIAAYSNSVKEYSEKNSNKLVVPKLPHFMGLMPDNGLVLDLASGHLRDPQYMINPNCRNELNREGISSSSPKKKLRVIPLESSLEFIKHNIYKLESNLDRVPFVINGDFMNPGVGTALYVNNQEFIPIFTQRELKPVLDGIWSCAGYMVHMIPEKLSETTTKWAETLKTGGIFAVSYIRRKEGQGNIKLLASRSAPGEIKVFSHYTQTEVDEAFNSAGMRLINMESGDYDGHGFLMSDFFGNCMYRKE